jgi:hypothetical protein
MRASRTRGPQGRARPPPERASCRQRAAVPLSGPSPGSGRGGTSSREPRHARPAGPCPPRASASGHAEARRAAPEGSRCQRASQSRSTRRRPAGQSGRAARPLPRLRPWRRAPRPTAAPALHGAPRRQRRPGRPGRRSARSAPPASRPFDHIAARRPPDDRQGQADLSEHSAEPPHSRLVRPSAATPALPARQDRARPPRVCRCSRARRPS